MSSNEATKVTEARPPCEVACPVHTEVRNYINAIARGEYEEAYRLARESNPFPYVCGRVCAHPCEDVCRRAQVDEPVAIAALKRFATEQHDLSLGHGPPLDEVEAREQKVAIVGSGPAGMAAAHDLVRKGYQVTVFEAHNQIGGMLGLGLPMYRLPRDIIQTDMDPIFELGVELRKNTRIGLDLTLGDLKKQGYEAIFIAVGGQLSRGLPIDGVDLEGVLGGVDFLRDVNLGREVSLGKRVLVIGGGNVAVDVARSAVRQAPFGEKEVHMICLECREEMPAHEWEIEEAKREGIILHPSKGPQRMVGEAGHVTGLETIVCTSVFDEEGRFRPCFAPDTEDVIEGDTVILAIGQATDTSFLCPEDSIEVTRRGTIAVDEHTLATSAPGIFAGGEVVTGPDLLIGATAKGQRAAIAIDAYLKGIDLSTLHFREPEELDELQTETIDKIRPFGRDSMPSLPLEKRSGNYAEVELGYKEWMAVHAAHRCLTCGGGAVVDAAKCTTCLTCVRICPYDVPSINGNGVAEIDLSQCQACGLCASECPAKAITLVLYPEEQLMQKIHDVLSSLNGDVPGPTILGFCCRYCIYGDEETRQVVKADLPDNVKTIDVLCTGRIDASHLLRAFELGADGVFVAGCMEEDCHNTTGSHHAARRTDFVKDLLDEVGLGRERLEMHHLPAGQCGNVTTVASDLAETVKEMGPNPLKRSNLKES